MFAAGFDRVMSFAERAGLRRMRAELLTEARGRTLEIGAGTGLNLDLYPAAVTELVLSEPSRLMAKNLRRRLPRGGRATWIDAPAERLPFPDRSFDTVVSTFVLCTVPEPAVALREVARVLRPSGRILVLEHVRSEGDSRLARWQDALAGAWELFACGCRCDRKTRALVAESPLLWEQVREGTIPRAPFPVRPMIVGIARRRA